MDDPLDLHGMSACLIVDSEKVSRWQLEALRLAMDRGLSIGAVLMCTNTIIPRRPVRHGAYYLLNMASMRHRWTTAVEWRTLVGAQVPVHQFDATWEGAWQRIPGETLERMQEYQFDAAIKFGMYLLRDPDDFPAAHGILSFHHGDPAEYRGRPAGFYELLNGADHVGVMVQRLSNRLDAGNVLAYGACKIVPHSYKATLENAYGNGTHLLAKALRNARFDRQIARDTTGHNYRLPRNPTVLRFAVRLLTNKAHRLVYGLTREKRWRIAGADDIDLRGVGGEIHLSLREAHPVPDEYAFLADPSVLDADTVLCEGMDRRSGKGTLVALTADGVVRVDTRQLGHGHLSNPHLVRDGGETYVLAEMAQLGPQQLAPIQDGLVLGEAECLQGLEEVRLTDPTIVHHDGRWWLFAGKPGTAADVLHLWLADELRGPYRAHPESPVVLDPSRARPAGPLQHVDGVLFRPGQDNRTAYGDGVVLSRIRYLTPDRYEEEPVATLRVRGARGPHTVAPSADGLVIDLYQEAFTPLAGLRRLRGRR